MRGLLQQPGSNGRKLGGFPEDVRNRLLRARPRERFFQLPGGDAWAQIDAENGLAGSFDRIAQMRRQRVDRPALKPGLGYDRFPARPCLPEGKLDAAQRLALETGAEQIGEIRLKTAIGRLQRRDFYALP